ncbi:MAG: Tex family protein [Miniphocaeibacter sp.]|uniref:Tex family protein n=1 Tax=Miniphocaeibacter sp. TaxID=3100973 RepID=UPI0017EE9361|nr:RNA-binding transcriptional accessory protein [Gallicola sp.]
MNINLKIAELLKIKEKQVEDTIKLIDEGNTIPFISRYRKEVTGNLSDTELRQLEEHLTYLRSLEQRKEDVIRLIDEQGKLTEELKTEIENAEKIQEVEDLYLPYKQKKRTRATIAKEKGLEPLADLIMSLEAKNNDIEEMAQSLIDEEKEVNTLEEALKGAMDIIAERISETKEFRDIVRNEAHKNGGLISTKAPDKEDSTYDMYYDFAERIKHLKPHRILAMFRGEKEGILKLKYDFNDEENIENILFKLCMNEEYVGYKYLEEALRDGYKRLLLPSIETEIKNELKEMADKESIEVFAGNLKPYLMQPPIKDSVVIGLDPGYRTGCKVAVISEHGKVLDYSTIYPTKPKEDIKGAKKVLTEFINKYKVNLIAIGNGTASRETESVVASLIEELGKKDLFYTIVNEAGASIYSASKLGDEEFPDLDVTIRGAISIARRIQDPLAELVKIEPQHIGVGQYQHDVNQKELKQTLGNVVEDCVNSVGVNVNTASPALLNYVSGISKSVAKNIVAYKEENGPFKNRAELNKVKGLGPKAFVQCAGFLRIPESENILDNTGVHPESYEIAEKLLGQDLKKIQISRVSKELEVGVPTLVDIVKELKKPGRDPRDEMPKPILRSDVLSIDDLEEGMILKGTVRNVVDFGAFVDIGIKNDGLVHISEMSEKFIKHPKDLVKVSDIVEVKIIGIDKDKGKVALSMKL